MSDGIYKPSEAAEKLGVTVKTLQRWDKTGKLIAGRTPTNRRYYTEEQIEAYFECGDESGMGENGYIDRGYILSLDRDENGVFEDDENDNPVFKLVDSSVGGIDDLLDLLGFAYAIDFYMPGGINVNSAIAYNAILDYVIRECETCEKMKTSCIVPLLDELCGADEDKREDTKLWDIIKSYLISMLTEE